MGLDLMHYKTVMTPEEYQPWSTPDGLFQQYGVEDFPAEAFSEYGFERHVQSLAVPQNIHFANFYENDEARAYDRKRHSRMSDSERDSYWLGTPETNDDALRELENRLGLDRSWSTLSETMVKHADLDRRLERGQSLASMPLSLMQSGARRYRRTVLRYHGMVVERGIFAVEVGYQRKGMTHAFYEYFDGKGRAIFVCEEEFKSLEGFLCEEMRDEPLPNLRANFIDNYERGRSFLYVSS